MDDILRQFKGVSDGLMSKVAGSPSSSIGQASSATSKTLPWNDDINKLATRPSMSESTNSLSDNDEGDKDVNLGDQDVEAATQARGWYSDHESTSKGLPQKVVKQDADVSNFNSDEIHSVILKSELNSERYPDSNLAITSIPQVGLNGVPPEVLFIPLFSCLFIGPSPGRRNQAIVTFESLRQSIYDSWSYSCIL